ncbi:MAG: 4Fe-4S dicluster domain-containing protein [Omnitrophica bacterium]|nr:4Fe-4S dicluster domain-containing protein [Candidatus Omnitrophota bacterium]
MLNKYRRFRGGYTFRKPEGVFKKNIETAPLPKKVIIPLKLRFGSKITLLVKKGHRVRAGQVIARDDETISTPAVASVNGTVEDILQINYFYGKVDAVVIRSDGTSDYMKLEGSEENYTRLSHDKISELIYTSGAASLGKSGIPTIFKSSPARPKSINSIIITTFGTGPFALDDELIFKGRESDFYKGLDILKRILPNAKTTIAMDKKNKTFMKGMIDAIRRGSTTTTVPDWIFVQPLEKKYPQESEDMLVRAILKKKIPIGGLGVDIGVLILDIHDVLRVYEAVALGKPFIERTVAFAGSAARENKYINMRIGVSLEEILKGNVKDNTEPRAIFGNALTGLLEKDVSMPVGRSIGHITILEEARARQFLAFMHPGLCQDSYSNAFLSSCVASSKIKYDTNMRGELRPCIQCGYCEEVCPVSIIPHLLSKQIKHDLCDGAEKLGIFECIDCGLCSYVCPCKIPLADDIASGKRKLIEEGCPVWKVKVKESEEAVKGYRGRMPL